MSPSAARRVASRGNQHDMGMAAPTAGCLGQYAPIVAGIPKYPLSLAEAGGYIVAIVTAK